MLKALFRFPRAPSLLIILSLLFAPLAACQTTTTGIAEKAVACHAYGKAITYSGSKDTLQTIYQVKVHNKSFRNLGCKLD